jgi:catechol 2,3-dioxygenase-like lactoylglutathione lyase family enzyme
MSLQQCSPIAFVATTNAEAARRFYEQVLGLTFVADDNFALVFRMADGIMLRIVRVPECHPVPFAILGWEAADMEAEMDALAAKGVEFLRYGFFEQDARGIWHAPNGDAVAWFQDPDGNTLSLSRHK